MAPVGAQNLDTAKQAQYTAASLRSRGLIKRHWKFLPIWSDEVVKFENLLTATAFITRNSGGIHLQ